MSADTGSTNWYQNTILTLCFADRLCSLYYQNKFVENHRTGSFVFSVCKQYFRNPSLVSITANDSLQPVSTSWNPHWYSNNLNILLHRQTGRQIMPAQCLFPVMPHSAQCYEWKEYRAKKHSPIQRTGNFYTLKLHHATAMKSYNPAADKYVALPFAPPGYNL